MLFYEDIYRKTIEGLLFISADPLSSKEIAAVLELDESVVRDIINDLMEEYREDKHGFFIKAVAGGYQFFTSQEVHPYLQKLLAPRQSRLSKAAYEVLAIVAYRQPITRSGIERIRGVSSDGPVSQLLQRGLIEEQGRMDTPGRPIVFGTTPSFLVSMGLQRIEDLPDYDIGAHFDFAQDDSADEQEKDNQPNT